MALFAAIAVAMVRAGVAASSRTVPLIAQLS